MALPAFWAFAIANANYIQPVSPFFRTLACFLAGVAIGRCLRLIYPEK